MSDQITPATAGTGGQLRTLAVRITEDLRAQLDIVAQLTGRSATEEIRLALEHWIEKTKSDPVILEKAASVRAEIERDAQTRRNAIAAIFGGDGTTTDETEESASPLPGTRRGNGMKAGAHLDVTVVVGVWVGLPPVFISSPSNERYKWKFTTTDLEGPHNPDRMEQASEQTCSISTNTVVSLPLTQSRSCQPQGCDGVPSGSRPNLNL